jgi:putative two-component system response regulator
MSTLQRHKILIVDDEEPIRGLIVQIVSREGHECQTASGVDEAMSILAKERFSLLISDINMPDKSGLDLLRSAALIDEEMAIIMATAVDDRNVAVRTLEMGAYGYIIKPFCRNELLICIANALRRRELEINNRKYSEELEIMVQERTKKLMEAEQESRDAREETITRLAKAAEFRDNETAQHTVRIGVYCDILAREAGCADGFCEQMRVAAPLHDVGKIGIPDAILLKPGALTKEEFEVIKTHPDLGFRILEGSRSDLLLLGAEIALTHHEKYNGSGYPNGLVGKEIPLSGRITAICDVFDALTSHRVYKAAMPTEEAIDILQAGRGTHFDPELLDLFFASIGQILLMKTKFADG